MKNTKICNVCKIDKSLDNFHKRKDSKDGLRNECKECTRVRINNYRKVNKEKVNKWNKGTYYRNINSHKNTKKVYRDNNKEKMRELRRIWLENNKEYSTKYTKERCKNDILFRLKHNIRSRIRSFLKSKKIIKNNKTFTIVGCEPFELKTHLEKQFKDGMSWDNYGLNGWQIDHIVPLISGKTEDEIYRLCHFTNLQPLWWYENLEKRY